MASSWVLDWSWGLPLLVLTIVAHVSAIVVTAKMLGKYRGSDRHEASRFIIFVAVADGHADVYLEDRWQLLGAIEAVNGVILFGLTTAFFYAAIHQVWPLRRD